MKPALKQCLSLRRLVQAFKYSLNGFYTAWQQETAFQQELLLSLVLVPLAVYIGDGGIRTLLMLISLGAVLVIELLNSALEAAVDHTSMQFHPMAKKAKDMASAAVLLTIIIAIGVWAWAWA